MATIKHIQTPDGVTHDIGGGGGSTTYTLTKSGSTITLTGSGGDVSSVVDANTTYALSLSGHTLTLTPSSGSAQSVTIPDDNTTYTIGISGTTITLTPSSGTAQTVTIPDATTTSAGVMSASDKTKLNGIESGAEVNVQSDWNQSNSSADDYIKNKPSLATVATTGDYDDLTNKPSLATVATTGDYDDLTNKPTIPTVNDGTLTIKQNGVTLDTFTANQSGNTTVDITTSAGSTQNTWYATCATSGGTTAKVATTTTADFVLATGNSVKVRFSSGSNASSPTLNVDGTGAIAIKENNAVAPSTYTWKTGEVVEFVYDGTYFLIVDGGTATTSYYGVTKLSSSTSSTSTTLAATPSAVKDAYDLADSKSTVSVTQTLSSGTQIGSVTVDGTTTDLYAPSGGSGTVTDVEVNGSSVVTGGVAEVELKTVNENSIVGTGNVQITKTLTQAQYDALTPAEQNNGVAYFVTDAPSVPDDILHTLYFYPGDTYVATGRHVGLCTNASKDMHFFVLLPKSAKYCSGFTITNMTGGVRISTGGYADNVGDGTSWSGRSGISFSGGLYNLDGTNHTTIGTDAYNVTANLLKTSAFKQNGTTTNVVNNTPVVLGGNIYITFT